MVGQPVSPLLQGKHHCEQLSCPNITIYLNWQQLSTIEGTRIEPLINWVPLGENSIDSNVQTIYLDHKLPAGVQVRQNWHGGKQGFQVTESSLSLMGPLKTP